MNLGTAPSKIPILVVDNHPIVCKGLACLIGQEKDLHLCGEAQTIGEALETVEAFKPEMIIMETTFRDGDGLGLIQTLKNHYPNILILVLSAHAETVYAERALRMGARGYLTKDEPANKLKEAIRSVLSGHVCISDHLATKMLAGLAEIGTTGSRLRCLSDRELQVFHLIGQGLGAKSIAEKLSLSVKTIETYQTNIKHKLSISSAEELKQYIISWEKDNRTSP